MSNYTLYTKAEDKQKRIDQFLKEQIPDISRNTIRSIIQAGDVKIGFKVIDDIAHPLDSHKKISVFYDEKKKYSKPKLQDSKHPLVVIYEDNEIIVIDKRAGMLSAPSKRGEYDTVVHLINNYIKSKYHKKFHTTHIIHRLDQAASGLLVYGRTKTAQADLKNQFSNNIAKQTFETIVIGHLPKNTGSIETTLSSKELYVKKVYDESEGEMAIMHYKILKKLPDGNTHLEVFSESKIRNQYRVQLALEGFPIIGDRKYNQSGKKSKAVTQLALHATKLEFLHPKTQKKVVFKSPLPIAIKKYLNQ